MLLVHVVQPAGAEAQVLQETREAHDHGGGASSQGGTPGKCECVCVCVCVCVCDRTFSFCCELKLVSVCGEDCLSTR